MKENESILVNHEFNLSDFALFLSVAKNPRAYRCMLSVFLEEPDIELAEVKVEQVILNKVGKRAIRLDAWANPRTTAGSIWKCKMTRREMMCGNVPDFIRGCWILRS